MINELLYVPPVENFRWINRERLYSILKVNQVSNAVFLSGDVHHGQLYEAQCQSFTGQNILPEVTSSGLSHTQADFFPTPEGNMRFFRHADTIASDIFMDYNYGMLEIFDCKNSEEIALKVSVRDIQGAEVLSKSYSKADLAFEQLNLMNGKLCYARASLQLNFRLLIQWLQRIFYEGDIRDTMVRVFVVMPGIFIVICSIVMRLSAILLAKCKICLTKK